MKKNLLIILFILLSFVVILSGCGKSNNSKDNLPVDVQKREKTNPNALDYMAPGYKQAQDKIKQIQDIKQQSLENNRKEFENVNY